MKREVAKLYKVIAEAEHRLKEIREQCPHPRSTPEMYMSGAGSIFPTLICAACGDFVAGITKADIDLVWSEWRAAAKAGRIKS